MLQRSGRPLQKHPLARLPEPPSLPVWGLKGGTLQAFEHLRSNSCDAANADSPDIWLHRPWRRRSKACGERRQKEARFWSHFRISLVVPRTSSDACRLARSLILPVSCHVQEHPLHPGGRRPRRGHGPHGSGPAAARPSQELNEIVIGVLGRAQRLYKVRICGFVPRLRRALDNDEIPSRRDRGKQL